MPGYLYPSQFVPVPVYNSPLELYQQSLMLKDAKFKQGLANVRSKYDSILNTSLTNGQNEMKLRSGVESVMNRLSTIATTDLSLPENQSQVNSLFDPITNDQDIMYDAAWTSNTRKELNKAESLQKTKPDLVPAQNLHPLYKAQEAYRHGDPKQRPGFLQFSPYYDYNSKYQDELDKIKADVDLVFSQGKDLPNSMGVFSVTGPDGKSYTFNTLNQQQVKELKESKVRELLYQRINTDSQAMHQMALDYDYNKDSGFYSQKAALDGINQDISTYRSITTQLGQVLASGTLSQTDRDKYQKQLEYYNNKANELSGVQNQIKSGGDPSQYFTFNQFVKDYVNAKALQYGYKDEGLLSLIPGYDTFLNGSLDMLKESFKLTVKTTAGLGPAETPLATVINSLLEQPTGVKADDRDIKAIGELDTKNNYNLSFENKTPESTVLIRPANTNLTQDQIKDLGTASYVNKLKKELDDLNINKIEYKQITAGDVYSGEGGMKEIHQSGDDIIRNYTTNKGYYGKDSAKIEKVLAKYKPLLDKQGVDLSKYEDIQKVDQKIQDPSLKAAIEFGESLANKAFRGKFEFRPDNDTNLVLGESGLMYMKGRLVIPESELSHAMKGRTARALLKAGLLTQEEINKTVDSDGKTAQDPMFGLSVYLPVSGKPEDINDRMLNTRGLYSGSDKDDYALRSQSKQNIIKYNEDLNNSRPFNLRTQFNRQGNNYVPQSNNAEVANLQKIAGEISGQTGQKSEEILQSIYNIVGSTNNPVKRYQGVQNLRLGLSGLTSDINSVGQFMKGIAGPETSGATNPYIATNSQTTASGKYQITKATFEKIQGLPTMPVVYKLESFDDFKKDPALQEAAMAVYSDYLLKRYSNTLAAAVAFYTGEASEETKAFEENPTKALDTYKDKKPSSGGSNSNITIGSYLSIFLRNYRK